MADKACGNAAVHGPHSWTEYVEENKKPDGKRDVNAYSRNCPGVKAS